MSSSYSHPIGGGLSLGRTDMGVDYSGSGDIFAIGDAVVTRVSRRGAATGWPGPGGQSGAMIVYRLLHGARAGSYVYLAENVDPAPGLKVGTRLKAGQKYARARGGYPFLEIGWAANAQGQTLSSAHGTTGSKDSPGGTPEGRSFGNFVKTLGKGKDGGSHPLGVGKGSNPLGPDPFDLLPGGSPVPSPDEIANTVVKKLVGGIVDAIGESGAKILLYVVLVGGGAWVAMQGLERMMGLRQEHMPQYAEKLGELFATRGASAAKGGAAKGGGGKSGGGELAAELAK